MLGRRVAVSISLFVVGILLLLVGFLSGICVRTLLKNLLERDSPSLLLFVISQIPKGFCVFVFLISVLRFGGRSVCFFAFLFLSVLGLSFSDNRGLLLCFCLL